MELRYTTAVTRFVDVFDLGRYLESKLGKSVEFIDSPNDTDYNVTIKKEEIDEYDMGHVNDFLEKGWVSFDYGYHAVLTHCANEGWLEEGEYVLRMSW